MTEQELKKEQFIAKAMENKEKFTIHKRLIEENLCIGGKMYLEDLKVFAERQVVDNQLLLNLMKYAESFAKETMKEKEVNFPKMEELEFENRKRKIEAFKTELKAVMAKYNFGKDESDNYNGMDEYCGTDYYFTVDGETWHSETIAEILDEIVGTH